MGLLKETINFYKERKKAEMIRKTLLNKKPDFQMLEDFIKKVNENPGLKITVYLNDGSRYELSTYSPNMKRDYERINGDLEIR